MIQWPSLLGGKHKLVPWLNKVLACCKASEIKQVIGGKLIENTDGKILVIDTPSFAGQSYPFRIYQGSDWLKVKVKTGYCQTTGDVFEPGNYDTDLTLTTATAKNWVYLDLTATTATFGVSATLPTFGGEKIPIGYVDTTDTTNQRQVITQLWKINVFNPCLT